MEEILKIIIGITTIIHKEELEPWASKIITD